MKPSQIRLSASVVKILSKHKKMKNRSSIICRLSIALVMVFSSSFSYGQEIINNSQTEIVKLPAEKIVRYFNNFNDHHLTDHSLNETKIESVTKSNNSTTFYLSENKVYESAVIVTNLNAYQKAVKEKSVKANILMLFKGEYNAEVLKHPIKPIINNSFSKNGILKWKITVEGSEENSAKLTFTFDSLDKINKQKFITQFSKGIDNNFNYTIQKIFVTENFKRDILNYLAKSSKADATDVQPTKGN